MITLILTNVPREGSLDNYLREVGRNSRKKQASSPTREVPTRCRGPIGDEVSPTALGSKNKRAPRRVLFGLEYLTMKGIVSLCLIGS